MQIIPKKFFSFPTKLLDYLVEREVTTLIWAVSALCIISTLKGFDYKVPRRSVKSYSVEKSCRLNCSEYGSVLCLGQSS